MAKKGLRFASVDDLLEEARGLTSKASDLYTAFEYQSAAEIAEKAVGLYSQGYNKDDKAAAVL